MVNKCSVAGCKSLYVKDNVKLHRFPLTNAETLPLWINATKREKHWRPCKSSRLCGNHFKQSEYIIGHGKGVLKSTAIPTIEYRVNIPRYTKRRHQYSNLYDETTKNKRKAHEPTKNDSNVEIIKVDYNDIYKTNENKIINEKSSDDYEEPYIIKDEEITNDNSLDGSITIDNFDYASKSDNNDNIEELNHQEIIGNVNSKKNIWNRDDQCYMFTSSFSEDNGTSVLTPPKDKPFDELSSISIDQTIANSNFNKIMGLKSKNQRCTRDIYSSYFQSLIKINVLEQEKFKDNFIDDPDVFGAFIITQLEKLHPYTKLYSATKHQIQKLLIKTRLKIESLKLN